MDQVTHCIAKEDEIRSIEVLEVPNYGNNKTERINPRIGKVIKSVVTAI